MLLPLLLPYSFLLLLLVQDGVGFLQDGGNGEIVQFILLVLSFHNPAKADIGEFEFSEQQTYLKLGLMLPKLTRTDSSANKDRKN